MLKVSLAAYGRKVWYRYIIPKRITMKHNPAVYRWIVWNFTL